MTRIQWVIIKHCMYHLSHESMWYIYIFICRCFVLSRRNIYFVCHFTTVFTLVKQKYLLYNTEVFNLHFNKNSAKLFTQNRLQQNLFHQCGNLHAYSDNSRYASLHKRRCYVEFINAEENYLSIKFYIYFAWRACSSWSLLHAGLGAPRSSCQGVPRASIRHSRGNLFTVTIYLLHTLLHNSSSRMYGATLES